MAYGLTSVMVRRAAQQRGGETSSAGVINESGIFLTHGAAFTWLPRGLQTPRSFTDGSESGQPTAPMNPESSAQVKCVRLHPGARLGRLFKPI